METGFEVDDRIVSSLNGRRGTVSSTRNSRVPMVEVRWDTGEKDWLPIEMILKDAALPSSVARRIFDQSDGDTTKAFYAELNKKGLHGQLGVALFRAQKRSTAAKKYRRGAWRRDAYDVKNWSLSEVCRIMEAMCAFDLGFAWGWQEDSYTPGFPWVLYVDLPGHGQCSFHSAVRLSGPDYSGKWDGLRNSREHILSFCDAVWMGENEAVRA